MVTRLVGLEISATAVRMAKVATSGNDHRLVAFAEAPLVPGTVVDGAIVEPAVVLDAIRRCMSAKGIRRGRLERPIEVQLGVAGLRAITRELDAPVVPDAELDQAVRLQALDVIPFPPEKTLLSARRLEALPSTSIAGAGVPRMKVLLAAAHRDLVDPFVAVAVQAGLVPAGVDLASSALVRTLGVASGSSGVPSGPEVIVSIGADLTTVVVHDAGQPLFVRTIAEGGSAVSRAIATALDVPFNDAETLKRFVGRPDRHTPPVALAAARDGSARILSEIRSSIDYYAAIPTSAPIQRILLTGGGARLSGLADRLAQVVSVPVERASCLELVHGDRLGPELAPGGALDDVAAAVIGLALPEAHGTKRLDLLPKDFVDERRLQRHARAVASVAAVVLLALVATGALRLLQVHNAERGVDRSRSTIAYLQRIIPRYNKVRLEDAAIVSDRALALPLVSYEVNWPLVLTDLSRYTPPSIAVSGFSGTATPPATTTAASSTVAAGSGAAPPPNLLALPPPTAVLGTVSLSFTGHQYPNFETWFNTVTASKRFSVLQFSGITSSSPGVSFSGQLDITGGIQTSRFKEFDFPGPSKP